MHLVFEIPGSETNPNNAENPTWYYPLYETGTWTLVETSTSRAKFHLHFPLNWPLPFNLKLPGLHVDIKHKRGSLPLIVVGTVNPVSGNFELLQNQTNQQQAVQLSFVSSPSGDNSTAAAKSHTLHQVFVVLETSFITQ